MSFLKQLLTPFVDFEDEEKKKAAASAAAAQSKPGSGSPGGQHSSNKTSNPAPGKNDPASPANLKPAEPPVHPLVNSSDAANSTLLPTQPEIDVTPPKTEALKQVPDYSPAGTITGPMPEHKEYFEKLIDEANAKNPLFQGTDYKEFIDSKIDIDDIADESIRYRTAFNILKSSGLTKEKLLSTGQEYLNLIGRDLNAFQGAHALQYQKDIRPKEQLIEKKVQELQALTLRINALKQEINQATTEIKLTKEKMNTTKQSFLLAGENKQKEIQTELDKIAHYF